MDSPRVVDVQPLSGSERLEKYGRYLDDPSLTRPELGSPEFQYERDYHKRRDLVEAAQIQYDAARASEQRIRDWSAGIRAEEARKADEATKAREEERAAALLASRDALESRLKARYLSQPGALPDGWERDKEGILADHFRQALANDTTADDAARRQQLIRTKSTF